MLASITKPNEFKHLESRLLNFLYFDKPKNYNLTVPLALYHIRAHLSFRAQILGYTKFIVHENQHPYCESGPERSCDSGKVSDLRKASDLGKACDFGKFTYLRKARNSEKVSDLETASDLEKATYLSLSATVCSHCTGLVPAMFCFTVRYSVK